MALPIGMGKLMLDSGPRMDVDENEKLRGRELMSSL